MKTHYLPALLLLAALLSCARQEKQPVAAPAPPKTDSMTIVRLSPELDNLIAPGAAIEVLAGGFQWSEGPVWVAEGNYLLFSDVPANTVYKWQEGAGTSVYLKPSGYLGARTDFREPGSNGLLLDAQGRLVLCQHGERQVARMNAPVHAPRADFIPLAANWKGKHFNSPNDAVFDKKGTLYFTDPPYGLPKQMDDPGKEIPFQGVYRCTPDGVVTLLLDSLTRPNGIALSPDQHTLYVNNSDPDMPVIMAYSLSDDGSITGSRVFYRAQGDDLNRKGLPDGLKTDAQGNVFSTGPGGVVVFRPDGAKLGWVDTGQHTANCCFGNNGKYLYITADDYLLRVALR